MAHPRPAVDRGLDRGAELDLVFDDLAVREGQPQGRGVGIGVGRDLDQLADDQSVDEAVRVIGQEEPPILERRRPR